MPGRRAAPSAFTRKGGRRTRLVPSRDTPKTDRQIHLLSPTSATVSQRVSFANDNELGCFLHKRKLRVLLKTHQPRVFVQNANSTYSLPGRSVEKLPAGWRASPPSFLPSLLLSLYTADSASELNRDCVRTNDERASGASDFGEGERKPPRRRRRRGSDARHRGRALLVRASKSPSVRPSP